MQFNLCLWIILDDYRYSMVYVNECIYITLFLFKNIHTFELLCSKMNLKVAYKKKNKY